MQVVALLQSLWGSDGSERLNEPTGRVLVLLPEPRGCEGKRWRRIVDYDSNRMAGGPSRLVASDG